MALASRAAAIATALAIGAMIAPVAHADGPPSAQGAPPILPTASPSQQRAIDRGEAASASSYTSRAGHYSSAERNAYDNAPRSAAVGSPPGGSTNNGFDYADAAVGAGITSGMVLLIGASGLAIRRRKQLHQP